MVSSSSVGVMSSSTVSGSSSGMVYQAGKSASGSSRVGITFKLPQLQNLCKRDPKGYRQDYDDQVRRLRSECDIVRLSHSAAAAAAAAATATNAGGTSTGGGGYNPSHTRLVELIQFAAAVSAACYKGQESDAIVTLLVDVLTAGNAQLFYPSNNNSSRAYTPTVSFLTFNQHAASGAATAAGGVHLLHKDIRRTCVSALILMRNKGAIAPLRLLELFFYLMGNLSGASPNNNNKNQTAGDKVLRETLYNHVVNDVRNINKHSTQEHLNRKVQGFLHKVILSTSQSYANANSKHNNSNNTSNEIIAKRAVEMVCELYRRKVWTDERTVAIMASAVKSDISTVMVRAVQFFLNIEVKMAEDATEQSNDDREDSLIVDRHKHSKKTRARIRHVEKQLKHQKKEQHRYELRLAQQDDEYELRHGTLIAKRLQHRKLYPAVELLHDPQGLAEEVFRKLRSGSSSSGGGGGVRVKTHVSFQVKLLLLNFVTRLVGNHELTLLPLYPFLQRYMGGQQREVTAILAYTVQACHKYVPPEEIYGILKTIAYNFITERCSGEQMAVGINAVREICSRVPAVLLANGGSGEMMVVQAGEGKDANEKGDKDSDSDSHSDSEGKKETHKDKIKRKRYNTIIQNPPTASASSDLDMEAFVQDLSSFSNYRDRSVSTAAKAFTNFIRETHPSLLKGKKKRGATGAALKKAGQMPLAYGQEEVKSGVEGAELLVEYEAKKRRIKEQEEKRMKMDMEKRSRKRKRTEDEEDEEEEEEEEDEDMDEEDQEQHGEDDSEADNDESEPENKEMQEESDDEEAPDLVPLEPTKKSIDVSKMSAEEKRALQQQVSSQRIFSAEDFVKIKKLVARRERDLRDPRAAARRKRAIARGKDFERLSDDDDSDAEKSDDIDVLEESDDEDEDGEGQGIRIKGAVNPNDIMAEAGRRKMNKVERLQSIVRGREAFTHKARAGGTTNAEKKRTKMFVMQKFSTKFQVKGSRGSTKGKKGTRSQKGGFQHENKKRRRKV